MNALMVACNDCKDPEVIKLLLSKGANINSKDHIGRTPLHFAARCGNVDVVRFLL